MRTKNIELYNKILKMISKGMKQAEIVSELDCSYTTISSAKKWAEKEAKKETKAEKISNSQYEYAINMLLKNKFFPSVWKKAINKYLIKGDSK
jgi:uncharacterized protein YjcR